MPCTRFRGYVKLKGEIEIAVGRELARPLGLYYGSGTLVRSKRDAVRRRTPYVTATISKALSPLLT
uniref:Uncharacterized protein n=1 Tax=Fervidicoccus fontis TaxID=683846 RepID=A0A7J3ZL24_9CREN